MNKPILIDANELVIETKKCLSLCETFRGYTAEDALKHFLLLIDEQPTAYNLDGVVEQLEELIQGREELYNDSIALEDLQTRVALRNQAIALKHAIEIVKKGGAE